MLQSWRWFGYEDPIALCDIRQSGVTDIVSALYHVPCGELWTVEEIQRMKKAIEWDEQKQRPSGLRWSIVESLPIHEDIKRRLGNYQQYIENYRQSLTNLAKAGIKIIAYNFMPVLDWTRSNINYRLQDDSKVLFYNYVEVTVFDLFILKREGAEAEYSPEDIARARDYYNKMSDGHRQNLQNAILLGLPGTVANLSLEDFRNMLKSYDNINDALYREQVYGFLNDIMPLCEELGIKMAMHPDDPPHPIFGVPRIMSTKADIIQLMQAVPSPNNGFTFCTGCFSANRSNNVLEMMDVCIDRVFFAHLRNIRFSELDSRSFYESESHLEGVVDMVAVTKKILAEEERRKAFGMTDWQIPFRPDHGKLMTRDAGEGAYAGYSSTGMMLGLAELRGVEKTLKAARLF